MCKGRAERQRLNQREWEKEYAWALSRNQIPRAADGEVCRNRLLSSLETGNEEIVVFRAGAGYGKTTVMAEWAQTHRARSCWYHLHESDNDVFRFLRGIAASFLCAGTENASDMDQFIKETWKDFFEMSETFFSAAFPRSRQRNFTSVSTALRSSRTKRCSLFFCSLWNTAPEE